MASAPIVVSSQLDNYLELRHRVLMRNDQGEEVASWPDVYAYVWAEKRDLRGQKRFLAQQYSSDQQTEFTVRWRGDVSVTDRLINLDENETYEITQVAEIGRRGGLDLLCRRIAS